MKALYDNPRTSVGGIIALAAVVGLLTRVLDLTAAVTLLGVAATWIGIAGKDGGKS